MAAKREPVLVTADVVPVARCTYRQLDHWLRVGWVAAEQPTGDGSGHARVWTLDEIGVACRMSALIYVGFRADAAARIARAGWGEDA